MEITAGLAPWLVLAAVLVASGIGKLRHPEGAEDAFLALKVPDALNRRWVIRAHPWGELALAAAMILLPHPFSIVAAALALVLFTIYLVLIWRVVASGEEASCNCFGAVGSGTVDGWTLTRNILLVALAVLTVVDAVTGQSALARLTDLGSNWWWVAGLAVTAAVTHLVTREGSSAPEHAPVAEFDQPEEDYLRLPTPDVPVVTAPGGSEISLRDLAAERAQVLLLLNPGCGPCKMISNQVAEWAGDVPEIDFRVVHSITHDNMRDVAPVWEPFYVQEVGGSVGSVFGNPPRPSAVLLGMDGLLAGGPVMGHRAVEELVEDLTAQIREAREANAEAERLNAEHEAELQRLAAEDAAAEATEPSAVETR